MDVYVYRYVYIYIYVMSSQVRSCNVMSRRVMYTYILGIYISICDIYIYICIYL